MWLTFTPVRWTRFKTTFLLFAQLFLLCLINIKPAQADERILLTGSSTIAPLALSLGKRFETQHPDIRVDVQTGGSTRGIHDVRRGLSQLGMASRPLKNKEQDVQAHLIALDGVGLIVHADNPLAELTQKQVIAIYTGQIENWSELGGHDRPITVVHKAAGHSTLELFLKHFALKNSQVKPDVIIGDNQQAIKTLIGNPDAIAYVSIGTAEYESQHGRPIKLLALDGVPASTETVIDQRYPLTRPLNLISHGKLDKTAKRFLQFAQSASVQDLIESHFFVAP